MNVYLAGTITAEERHLAWRETLTKFVESWGHTSSTPLRYQDPSQFQDDGLHDKEVPSSFFVRCNTADLDRSDIVFLVFWKGVINKRYSEQSKSGILLPQPEMTNQFRRQSIGTWCEFWQAVYTHKPVIVVTDDHTVAEHPYIANHAAYVTNTLEDGFHYLRKFLS